MLRATAYVILVLMLAGCRVTEREGFKPLPENGPPMSFEDMVGRARAQAGIALDAFYVDAWLDLEQAGQRLEQTARLLPKSTEIPASLKTILDAEADLLRQDAAKLSEAARAKNASQANTAMQRINFRIRQLRPQEKSPVEAP
jgi:hypothetical protein